MGYRDREKYEHPKTKASSNVVDGQQLASVKTWSEKILQLH